MKLSVQLNKSLEEPSVLVEYAEVDREVEAILAALNSIGTELVGRRGKELVRIPAAEVLYCESVDGSAFLYTSEAVIESALRLSDIEQRVRHTGFVRVSRTMLVNLYRVTGLRPFPNARLQLLMDNGEYVVASRQFAPTVKKKLGL
ncbi:LytTR family DNA-binding domain-containing protein [Adlercreutzia equolifaciens]|uniref:LytTR family DNA-binding domain-containing protein n=1 Tax=Adlercreutzia equolifaciens TaxID=446660 RepID=UPI0023AF1F4C|nr:LytTR family DNA-binding domain-containing protein [Adlercreutzia equolifaciens]MDE8701770.1 LytTR family DNA-binding domain-containing protein [Adlercreutzia equolifaciens]